MTHGGWAPERRAAALPVEHGWIERGQVVAERLRRASVEAHGALDLDERVVAAVGVLDQGDEERRRVLFDAFQYGGLQVGRQADKVCAGLVHGRDRDLAQPVEEQPPQANRRGQGMFDGLGHPQVARASQPVPSGDDPIQGGLEHGPLRGIEHSHRSRRRKPRNRSLRLRPSHLPPSTRRVEPRPSWVPLGGGGLWPSGWHLLGTCRMGERAETSVVDPWGRAHDVDNLFIVDGSIFVTSAAVNPTTTIQALALRTADHINRTRHHA
jgi:choline dehydrogenase-like flavoprotein